MGGLLDPSEEVSSKKLVNLEGYYEIIFRYRPVKYFVLFI